MSYTWTIENLQRVDDGSGGVEAASCRCTKTITVSGTDYSASSLICVPFDPDPTSESFIPYNDLTESVVWTWVNNQASIDKAWAELEVDIQLDTIQNPPTSTSGVPW